MSLLLRIAERVISTPLLIHPDKVPMILAVLEGRIALAGTDKLTADADELIDDLPPRAQALMRGAFNSESRSGIDASAFVGDSIDVDPVTGERSRLAYRRTAEGVAVIPVIGSLVNRGAWLGASSGLTSYEGLKFQLQQASIDPRTSSIILDIESPGGEAVGAFELAEMVRAIAKPVVAVVNGMAASAAYAIASAADRIVTTSVGVMGSVGVVFVHADLSRKLDKAGITPTVIFAGDHKADGNPFEPLPEEVRADLQRRVNAVYDLFVETVAAGRPAMSAADVRATGGRVYIGAEAVATGLADQVGTFETVLADLSQPAAGRVASNTKVRIFTHGHG